MPGWLLQGSFKLTIRGAKPIWGFLNGNEAVLKCCFRDTLQVAMSPEDMYNIRGKPQIFLHSVVQSKSLTLPIHLNPTPLDRKSKCIIALFSALSLQL